MYIHTTTTVRAARPSHESIAQCINVQSIARTASGVVVQTYKCAFVRSPVEGQGHLQDVQMFSCTPHGLMRAALDTPLSFGAHHERTRNARVVSKGWRCTMEVVQVKSPSLSRSFSARYDVQMYKCSGPRCTDHRGCIHLARPANTMSRPAAAPESNHDAPWIAAMASVPAQDAAVRANSRRTCTDRAAAFLSFECHSPPRVRPHSKRKSCHSPANSAYRSSCERLISAGIGFA